MRNNKESDWKNKERKAKEMCGCIQKNKLGKMEETERKEKEV